MKFLSTKIFVAVVAGMLGFSAGVLLFPTTDVEERLRKELEEKYSAEAKSEIEQMFRDKEEFRKKYDEEHELRVSEEVNAARHLQTVVEEFEDKMIDLEKQWKLKYKRLEASHQADIDRIKSQPKECEVVSNETPTTTKVIKSKRFRAEAGLTSKKDLYLHGSYNIKDNWIIGAGVSTSDVRVGVGIEF